MTKAIPSGTQHWGNAWFNRIHALRSTNLTPDPGHPTDPRSPRGQCRSELQSFRPWCQRKWRKAILEQLWISLETAFTRVSQLPAIWDYLPFYWMWNNLCMGLWILQNKKKTSNIFITLIDQWLPVTFSSKVPDARPGKHTPPRGSRSPGQVGLHTWIQVAFTVLSLKIQRQNVSWDKTDMIKLYTANTYTWDGFLLLF